MWIYLIRNNINDKIYVGKAKNIDKRWKRHLYAWKYHEKKHSKLYLAMSKHGIDVFSIEPIFFVLHSELVNYYEKLFITEYDSVKQGYNIRFGGEGGGDAKELVEFSKNKKGKTLEEIFSIEKAEIIKQRMSNSLKGKLLGRTISEEVRSKVSNTLKYKWTHDLKFRYNMSVINKNKAKSGIEHHFWGKKHSEKSRKLISINNTGNKWTDERKKLVSEKQKGENNPNFKHINTKDLLEYWLKNPNHNMDEISKNFGISRPTLTKHIKELFDIDNIQIWKRRFTPKQFEDIINIKIKDTEE